MRPVAYDIPISQLVLEKNLQERGPEASPWILGLIFCERKEHEEGITN